MGRRVNQKMFTAVHRKFTAGKKNSENAVNILCGKSVISQKYVNSKKIQCFPAQYQTLYTFY